MLVAITCTTGESLFELSIAFMFARHALSEDDSWRRVGGPDTILGIGTAALATFFFVRLDHLQRMPM